MHCPTVPLSHVYTYLMMLAFLISLLHHHVHRVMSKSISRGLPYTSHPTPPHPTPAYRSGEVEYSKMFFF